MVKVSRQPNQSTYKRAEKVAERVVEKAVGRNPTLAKLAMFYQMQIPVVGVPKVRKMVMDAIDVDVRRLIKENTEPEAARKALFDLLSIAMKTPEYAKLLEMVDLGEEHTRIMINEAVDKKWLLASTSAPVLQTTEKKMVCTNNKCFVARWCLHAKEHSKIRWNCQLPCILALKGCKERTV